MGYVCGGVCVHWEEGQIISYLTRKIEICQQALSQHLGSIHPPLLNIEMTEVVVDELHLLLWVTDVLIRNLVSIAAS